MMTAMRREHPSQAANPPNRQTEEHESNHEVDVWALPARKRRRKADTRGQC